jgi:hypothetical protein
MSMPQLAESEHQCIECDGRIGGPISPTQSAPTPHVGSVGLREFRHPEQTSINSVLQRNRSEISTALVVEYNRHDQFESERSQLRDPEFESAVDRIIDGLDLLY